MREEVKKFLFIGLQTEKEEFFKKAQLQEIIHFIPPASKGDKEISQEMHSLKAAIKVLQSCSLDEKQEPAISVSIESIVSAILLVQQRQEALQEESRVITLELSRVAIFGEFSFDDKAYIEQEGNCQLRFFCARSSICQLEEEPDSLFYVGSENGLNYYLSFGVDHPIYEKMVEMTLTHSLGELKQKLSLIEKEQQGLEQELRGYVKYKESLCQCLVEKWNLYHLSHVGSYVQELMEGSLFAIEGWIPTNKIEELEQILFGLTIHAEEVAIESTDLVPTYLENQGVARLGEDLVHIYDTPSATDKDPSLWVLGGFSLFFAFIIGDAGYGLLYLALALFLRYRFPSLEGLPKRALNLFTVLSVGCILWGTLVTSFFGMQLKIDNPIRRLSLVQWLAEKKIDYYLNHDSTIINNWIEHYPELEKAAKPEEFIRFTPASSVTGEYILLNQLTNEILFEMALFVGVIHLLLSLCRYAKRQWQNMGWILFLIGAYLYFPFHLGAPSFLNSVCGIDLVEGGRMGFQCMLIGISGAWILAIIRHGWTGIFEIMTLIQVFADTLSYLRLYALGLAGATVAATVNEIARELPLIPAALLILIAHLINIVLSTMGGVIHGLRLNFLEWYHYSFEGGGKRFQPLKLLNRE